MLVKTTDGTPDAVKVARPVWSGGKSGDNFKGLPITISRTVDVHIGQLRKKLKLYDEIKTIPKLGYRLEEQV